MTTPGTERILSRPNFDLISKAGVGSTVLNGTFGGWPLLPRPVRDRLKIDHVLSGEPEPGDPQVAIVQDDGLDAASIVEHQSHGSALAGTRNRRA